ncbi:MAG: NAD(+)/NADH kinase, partial [Proteobacteria bacterium]|nr:NAD(+)/NADH kinase [Pseudomonadota bacterium]
MLSVGLIVNPVAGIGGEVSLKGSDGSDLQQKARAKGGVPRGGPRAQAMFDALGETRHSFDWVTWSGGMGERVLRNSTTGFRVLGQCSDPSSSEDTVNAAQAMLAHKVDLLVFSGGDGTARDLYRILGQTIPVLGIPSGVKMHSGVFATTPAAAANVLRLIAQ